jgi:hypothetical protein
MKTNIKNLLFVILISVAMALTIIKLEAPVQAKALSSDEESQVYKGDSSITSMGDTIVSVVGIICYGAAVIVLLVKGVKFMKAAPEGKAQIKEEMVAAAVGAIILFAIGTFIQIIAKIAKNLF